MRSRARSNWAIVNWFNDVTRRHYLVWGFLKWMSIGAIAATALFFSGGFAAIPFLAPVLSTFGPNIIAASMPVLAVAAALTWNVIVKPVARFFAWAGRSIFKAFSSTPDPDSFRPAVALVASRVPPRPGNEYKLLPQDPDLDQDPLPASEVKRPSRLKLGSGGMLSSSEGRETAVLKFQAESALAFRGGEVDLSYMYDCMTVYFKSSAEINRKWTACEQRCDGLDFVVSHPTTPRGAARSNKFTIGTGGVRLVDGMHFDRYIHQHHLDHGFYHQDRFKIPNSHSHMKFKGPLSETQLGRVLQIYAEEKLITPEQKDAFVAAFKKRNKDAELALERACQWESKGDDAVQKKEHCETAIILFISSQRCNDVLLHVHDYLLDPKFAYLRRPSPGEVHPKHGKEWQGVVDLAGNIDKTSRTWATIENAITKQMMQNFRETSELTAMSGSERADQFSQYHAFFGIKRSRPVGGSSAGQVPKKLKAFAEANEAELTRKHRKTFN